MAGRSSRKTGARKRPRPRSATGSRTAKLRSLSSQKATEGTTGTRRSESPAKRVAAKSVKARKAVAPNLSKIKAEISAVHARRGDVWLKRDAEGYLANYADDALLVVDGSLLELPALGSWLYATLEAGGGSMSMSLPPTDNVVISPKGDSATAVFQWSQRFRTAEGEVSNRTYVETNVWHRLNGAWKIVRLHITTLDKNFVM